VLSVGSALRASSVRLGVLGWPVAHSRSPSFQNAALRAVGLSGWRYQLLPVPPELFEETVRALPGAGFGGANVTIPHKRAAVAVADDATTSAREIGAANTLMFELDGTIHADNTDAPALIAALPSSPVGATALVLGAGGTARAAVWALQNAGASEVRVWNRTPDRARRLCAELGGVPVRNAAPADLLVHCTASGLDPAAQAREPAFDQLPIDADQLNWFGCIVDFVYGATRTAIVESARARSIPVVDGLTLLVGQGALSFERFTGLAAPVATMRAALGLR
jgi:shikimate dehydrogenase